jgi:hypothetical protein
MSRSPDRPVIEFDHLSARYAADPLSKPSGGQPSGSEHPG